MGDVAIAGAATTAKPPTATAAQAAEPGFLAAQLAPSAAFSIAYMPTFVATPLMAGDTSTCFHPAAAYRVALVGLCWVRAPPDMEKG